MLTMFLQNFVGLSVSDGYIATGSETNEVKGLLKKGIFLTKVVIN